MFVEELTKIKESENKADQLQKKAKVDSKQVLEDARTKAEKIIEEASLKAKNDFDTLINEGQKTSDEQYDMFLDKTRIECETMITNARNNEEKAIGLIAERIVG